MLNFIKNNQDYLKDFITRSTYHSNAIEGSTLTYAETYAILFNDNNFKIQNREPREIYEAINHKKAMILLLDRLENSCKDLDEELIKKINQTINQDILNTESYRKVNVIIKGSEHIPPSFDKLNSLMMYFVYNYNNDNNSDIFDKIAYYHLEFESIHPFEDVNGRTGRILLNYELLKNNLPPIVIPKDERGKYFELLRNKDIENLSKFFKALSDKEKERLLAFGFKD